MKPPFKGITQYLLLCVAFVAVEAASAFYDSGLGRWINRDPIEEDGGRNLYGFVSNNPIRFYDAWGLFLGQNYGLYCGWNRRGPGTPIDQIDAACQRHDNCLATWSKACNPNNQAFCHYQFCYDAKYANCTASPTPAACTRFRAKILATCPAIVFVAP